MSFSITSYITELRNSPWEIFTLILDIIVVIFLIYEFVKLSKKSRVWQLMKGIAFLIIITFLSGALKLRILNFILTSVMTYGVIALLVIFQPELRRALEQLGSTNNFTKFFGIDKSLKDRTKEDIYKIIIAIEELSKTKTGALIVFERDIRLQDIIDTGIITDAEISPQILVNVFVPNTPLHDGAVVISNNKIASVACILPLADDKDIARELGTRHRAAMGISRESDAIAVVVSEETGKISIAKDGTLIADVKDDALKHILIKYLINARFGNEEEKGRITKIKGKIVHNKNKNEESEKVKS
ncbi:MAG: diadenylate cyclase CdaA [Clostridia bacterium]|nr:diadenylate cyclase CdaA [Clostridia bacterium]